MTYRSDKYELDTFGMPTLKDPVEEARVLLHLNDARNVLSADEEAECNEWIWERAAAIRKTKQHFGGLGHDNGEFWKQHGWPDHEYDPDFFPGDKAEHVRAFHEAGWSKHDLRMRLRVSAEFVEQSLCTGVPS